MEDWQNVRKSAERTAGEVFFGMLNFIYPPNTTSLVIRVTPCQCSRGSNTPWTGHQLSCHFFYTYNFLLCLYAQCYYFFCVCVVYIKVLLDINPTLLQCGNVLSNDRHLLKFALRRQYYVVIQAISAVEIQCKANTDQSLLMATILQMGPPFSLAVTTPLCSLRGASHSAIWDR